ATRERQLSNGSRAVALELLGGNRVDQRRYLVNLDRLAYVTHLKRVGLPYGLAGDELESHRLRTLESRRFNLNRISANFQKIELKVAIAACNLRQCRAGLLVLESDGSAWDIGPAWIGDRPIQRRCAYLRRGHGRKHAKAPDEQQESFSARHSDPSI